MASSIGLAHLQFLIECLHFSPSNNGALSKWFNFLFEKKKRREKWNWIDKGMSIIYVHAWPGDETTSVRFPHIIYVVVCILMHI